MFFFGHVGITVGAIHRFSNSKKSSPSIDYRWVAIGSILPDLLDKPVGLLYPNLFGNNTRLAAHSWFSCLTLLLFAAYFYKKHNLKWLTVSYLMHMILDQMWGQRERIIFLYPFLGNPIPWAESATTRWLLFYQNSYTVTGELLGILILIKISLKYNLFKIENFKKFLSTGKLEELRT